MGGVRHMHSWLQEVVISDLMTERAECYRNYTKVLPDALGVSKEEERML